MTGTTHQLVAIENRKGYLPITQPRYKTIVGAEIITVRRRPVGVEILGDHQRSWFSDLMWVVCSDRREWSLQLAFARAGKLAEHAASLIRI